MPALDWIGKQAVIDHLLEIPYHLLKYDEELSVGDANGGNLLVQGDNLLALKTLLPFYAGQVKCIYIDPPYNTGNEKWSYNDAVNSPEIKVWLGRVVGGEVQDLSRHDKWLCMMYPRLQLLRQFLRQDGVIMISIDDFEVHHLRCLLDEIYGPNNFIANLVWDKTRKNDAKLFSVGHEYLTVYAKSLSMLRNLNTVWRESKPGADEIIIKYEELKAEHGDDYQTMEKELRRWYKSLPKGHASKKHSRYKHIDERGVWRDRDISWPGGGGPDYEVIHPETGKSCKIPDAGWRFATQEAMQRQIQLGLVEFREDESDPPFRKAYLNSFTDSEDGEDEEDVVGPQVMSSIIYKQAQVAVKLLRNMFDGQKVFDNPKDHEVLMRLINYVTGPDDIIMDSFAGSGSTGHAVLQLNKENSSHRKFILIEIEQDMSKEITRERLRRAIEGYRYHSEGDKTVEVRGLDGGFRYCELGVPLFSEQGNISRSVSFADLASHVYFAETGQQLPLGSKAAEKTPLLGVQDGVAIYLLFEGVLDDQTANGGNLLTSSLLSQLPMHDGPKIIYGEGNRLGIERLRNERITFKQIPYDIKVG